jgi:hypothetical protein
LDVVKDCPNYKFIRGNICSSDLINFVLATEQIDTVMHFAAQTHVDNSFGNSFQFTQNNIMGTHVLLESAKVANIKRFIHVSTDEVYGEQHAEQEAMMEEQVRRSRHLLARQVSLRFIRLGIGAHEPICSHEGGSRILGEVIPPIIRDARDYHPWKQCVRPPSVSRKVNSEVRKSVDEGQTSHHAWNWQEQEKLLVC